MENLIKLAAETGKEGQVFLKTGSTGEESYVAPSGKTIVAIKALSEVDSMVVVGKSSVANADLFTSLGAGDVVKGSFTSIDISGATGTPVVLLNLVG